MFLPWLIASLQALVRSPGIGYNPSALLARREGLHALSMCLVGVGWLLQGLAFRLKVKVSARVGGVTDPDREKEHERDAQCAGEKGLVLSGTETRPRAGLALCGACMEADRRWASGQLTRPSVLEPPPPPDGTSRW